MNHKLKELQVGNLYRTDMCTLWGEPCKKSINISGNIVGEVKLGGIVILLEQLDNEFKVLSQDGKVGWIIGRFDGRSRLHSL